MIYIPDITDPVTVTFPRTVGATPGSPVLELVGTTDRQRHAIPIDNLDAGVLYISVLADFAAIKTPGEYEYQLTDNGLLLASGIMRLGSDPQDPPVQYVKQVTYEQYNA